MAAWITLGAFALSLFICLAAGMNLLIALVLGLILFFCYGLYKGFSAKEMLKMALSGISTVKNILITFVLIGMLTALWRECGTIPFIVSHAMRLFSPATMVLMTFLLCAVVSLLTGTAFGTAATMGVICVTMANGMGIPVFYTGGAVLAGSYFGDRCSPMSTSALLISTLTKTDLYRNLVNMFKTGMVPLLLTCGLYAWINGGRDVPQDVSRLQMMFEEHFVMHPAVIIPAVVIVVLSLMRINVKITMGISILSSIFVAVFVQKILPMQLLRTAVFGFEASDLQLREMLSGGGILSMARIFCIVCISSCYSGMFGGTGILSGVRNAMNRICGSTNSFFGILLASVLTGVISCNQTLTIMLTHQICAEAEPDPAKMASHLENTAAVIAPLIPWSIAGAVPLAAVGAPTESILMSVYLYLLPLWNLIWEAIMIRRCRTKL